MQNIRGNRSALAVPVLGLSLSLCSALTWAADEIPAPAKSLAVEEQDPVGSEEELARQIAEQLGDPEPVERPRTAADPITLISNRSGSNYMQISLDGMFVAGSSSERDVPGLQGSSHDPTRRGFNIQNVELVLSGAVDPYFTAQANVVFVEAPDGETIVELEEFYGTTSSLPANLQVKVGHFYSDFGRLNAQHPHTWDFVDAPLSQVRMFGADGLRSSGVRVSWLMPTPFYSELFVAVQNAFGETLTSFGANEGEEIFGRTLGAGEVRNLGDLLFVPRYALSLEPTENQTLLVGASAAMGPNGTGENGSTDIYGVDAFWKWKSPRAAAGFPFVKVQAETMQRRYRVDDLIMTETFRDRATYGQVLWGFRRGWVAGLRYDDMRSDDGGDTSDPALENRSRASANVTWFPTEFSKLRLQYNRDDRSVFEDANSIWLQLELTLGAHAAHKL